MRTEQEVFVSGDMKAVHICDNCEEKTDDGRAFYYWKDREFTLCYGCMIELSNKI